MQRFWERADFCKQDKEIPKIKDFVNFEARGYARRTIGKPDFRR